MTARLVWSWLICCTLTGLSFAQDATPPDGELLERIKRLEEQVQRLQGDAAPPETPASSSDDSEGEWRLPASQAAEQPPKKRRSYDLVQDWPFPYGFVDDGKHPVIDLPQDMQLKLRGEVRARGEYRDPADYRIPGQAGRPATDDQNDATDFALLRTRIGLDFKVHRHLRALIELQDSRIWGDATPGDDSAEVYVRQAFAELSEPFEWPIWLWVGRWDVPELGDGRLVSPLYFANVTRSWDGVQFFGHFGGTDDEPWAWLTAFSANVREGAVFSADGDENDDFWFSGAYLSLRGWKSHEIDFYIFHRYFSDRIFSSERSTRPGDRKDFTFGTRSAHDYGWVGYTTEIAYQSGDVAGDRIGAWAAAATAWLKFELGEERALKVTGEYAYASGDRKPGDGKVQNFDPLVPRNYRHHGNMNLVAWSNVHAVTLRGEYTVFKGLSLSAKLHGFWLDKRKDGWFMMPHTLVRRDPTGQAGSFLGNEVDLGVEWKLFDDHLTLKTSYCHFWSGEYIRDTGRNTAGRSSGGMDFAYLELTLSF